MKLGIVGVKLMEYVFDKVDTNKNGELDIDEAKKVVSQFKFYYGRFQETKASRRLTEQDENEMSAKDLANLE
jgi:hypothetical protein